MLLISSYYVENVDLKTHIDVIVYKNTEEWHIKRQRVVQRVTTNKNE